MVDWVIRLVMIVVFVGVGLAGSAGVVVAVVVGIPVFVWYHAWNGGVGGQTLGMKLFRVRLVDAHTGAKIGFARALVRWVLELLMVLIVGILWVVDLLWPLWDAQNQTLHDKAVGSVVISTSAKW
jgi:uncharacterized RDD family membrane protein YckC